MQTVRVCRRCGSALPATSAENLCPTCLAESQANPTLTMIDPPPHNTHPFRVPRTEELKHLFPQLEIFELIGRGGMGAVYRARQRGLDRPVALKILPPQVSAHRGFAERFAREARALARLNHPNIVTVFDLGRSGSLYYFLMEYVDGVSLRQLLQSRPLTPREAMELTPQICEALEFAHQEGIVHRDIKPENILLDRKGRVKIADFGLAKLMEPGPRDMQLTQPDQVMGTPHYMAPEQFERAREVDHRADIYSLGVVLYEMLTGGLPVGRFDPPSRKAAVDPRLDELVMRALENEPNRRIQHVNEFRIQLESIAGAASRLSPEASRKLGYEYRSKTTLFGWPLLHVATGVDPVTGRKRSAKGIIAIGTAPRGFFAFGDFAVGVIACGILGCGVISISVVGLGAVAIGSMAVGLVVALGGIAIGPVAIGAATLGYYASGAMAWGTHAVSALGTDPAAEAFFSPFSSQLMVWIVRGTLITVPLFFLLGSIPSLMAKISAHKSNRRLRPAQSQSKTLK